MRQTGCLDYIRVNRWVLTRCVFLRFEHKLFSKTSADLRDL